MNPAATVGVYAGALALVFAAAVGVGNAVGPVGTAGGGAVEHSTAAPHSSPDGAGGVHGDEGTAPTAGAEIAPGGLTVTQDGYTLRLEDTSRSSLDS